MTTYRRPTKYVPKASVLEIAHEEVCSVREGQRIPKDNPLNRDDSGGHESEKYDRQCRLASRETCIKEAECNC